MIYFNVSPFIDHFFITLSICTFLVFGLLFFNKEKGMQIPSLFVYLGDMSYSLFLVHPIVVIVLPNVVSVFGYEGKPSGFVYFFILITVILGFSVLSYELLEKRVLKRLTHVLTTRGLNTALIAIQSVN
jgi:exopolysaccharide production protein ExoZ